MRTIKIFDTTLRDGEQAPGATLMADQKIAVAEQLVKLGVDVIESGFPVSSRDEFEAVQRISRRFQEVEISGFARAVKGDIDAAVKATQDAAKRRLHLFISSSDIHLNHQLRRSRPEVLDIARQMVAYAKSFTDEIEFSAMDASRSGLDYIIEMVEAVISEGATIINLPDTVGYALPEEYGNLFRRVRNEARGAKAVQFSAHCHNDLGLAVANSLAAIQAGADQVEVTVNGVGERTGNCALEELVMAIKTRSEVLGVKTDIDPTHIYETSRMVSKTMRFPIAYNKPIIGRNAFQHESGIHQDGLLKNRQTYEIMEPESLGISRSMIILGKHSGRHAIKHRVEMFGIELEEQQLEQVYTDFKQTADKQKIVTDDQLLSIVGEIRPEVVGAYTLTDLQVVAGSQKVKIASVTLKDNREDKESTYTGVGRGPLEAVIHCLQQAIPLGIEFEDLELHSLTSGESAFGEAAVSIGLENQTYRGTSMHQDILLAAAQAYVSACNQAVQVTEKNAVQ